MNRVSVVDIILAVDGPIDATQYKGKENCHNGKRDVLPTTCGFV